MIPSDLLAQAEECLREGRPEEALPLAKRALATGAQDLTNICLPSLNVLAEINLELGNSDDARKAFLQAVELDPEGKISDAQGGGAAEKFLWLAQLSEDGGEDSVRWFEKGAEVLKRDIAAQVERIAGEPDDVVKGMMKKLASALCGIVEIYMTDLSYVLPQVSYKFCSPNLLQPSCFLSNSFSRWEPDAEPRCESLITEALLAAPHSPEPLQTLASIRISQSRIPQAKTALSSSMDLWKDLTPEDTAVPDFSTRISLARLLMEVEMEEEALEVVERLVGEDDQSIEAWYLGGWCLYLLGQKKEQRQHHEEGADSMDHVPTESKEGAQNDGEISTASLLSSREWLRQSLTLYQLLEYEDNRLRDHAVELVDELDERLKSHDVDGGDYEGDVPNGEWESEGDPNADEDEGRDGDEMMDGTENEFM